MTRDEANRLCFWDTANLFLCERYPWDVSLPAEWEYKWDDTLAKCLYKPPVDCSPGAIAWVDGSYRCKAEPGMTLGCPQGTTPSGTECLSASSCPDGWTFDTSLYQCVSVSTAPFPSCPSGYSPDYWNGDTLVCVKNTIIQATCPGTSVLNTASDICSETPKASCPSAYIYDGDKKCLANPSCPAGTIFIGPTGMCSIPLTNLCPSGFTYDTVISRCIAAPPCPKGIQVAADPYIDGSCPAGFTFNPETLICNATVDSVYNKTTDTCTLDYTKACPYGYKYNPATDRCERKVDCPSGTVFNYSLNTCTVEGKCADGSQVQETGKCQTTPGCPQGYAAVATSEGTRCEITPQCNSSAVYDAVANNCSMDRLARCPDLYAVKDGICQAYPICPQDGVYGKISKKCEAASTITYFCPITATVFTDLATCTYSCKKEANCLVGSIAFSGTASASGGQSGNYKLTPSGNYIKVTTPSGALSQVKIAPCRVSGTEIPFEYNGNNLIMKMDVNASGGINVTGYTYIGTAVTLTWSTTWSVYGCTATGSLSIFGSGNEAIGLSAAEGKLYPVGVYGGGGQTTSGYIQFTPVEACPLADIPCVNGKCTQTSACQTMVDCPSGFVPSGLKCIADPTCPPPATLGFVAATDSCQTEPEYYCPLGFAEAGARCIGSAFCPDKDATLDFADDRCYECPAGFTYKPETKTCVELPACPAGAQYDYTLNLCVGEPTCTLGGTRNGDTCSANWTPVCPAQWTYNTTYKLCSQAAVCPDRSSLNISADLCTITLDCPAGFTPNNSTGNCEAAPTCPSGAGYDSNLATSSVDPPFFDVSLMKCTVYAQYLCSSSLLSKSPASTYDPSGVCTGNPICSTGQYNTATDRCEKTEYQSVSCTSGVKVDNNCVTYSYRSSCRAGTYDPSREICSAQPNEKYYSCPGAYYSNTKNAIAEQYVPWSLRPAFNSPVPLVSGLVGYWKMDGNWNDSAGNNHGTAFEASFATGYSGKAGQFDGTNDYIYAPVGSWLGVSNTPWSVSAWFYSTGSGGPIVGITNCPPGGCWNMPFMSLSNSGYLYCWPWGGEQISSYVGFGQWTQGTCTYSPVDGVRLYVNGTLKASSSNTSYSASGGYNYWTTYIPGAKPSGVPSYFKGLIDEVAIYSKTLSADDVKNVYYGGAMGMVEEPPYCYRPHACPANSTGNLFWLGVKYPRDLTNPTWQWYNGTYTITADSVASADHYGSLTADKIERAAGSNSSQIYQTVQTGKPIGGRTFTFTLWGKLISGSPPSITLGRYNFHNVCPTASITSSGWQLYSVTCTMPSSETSAAIQAQITTSSNSTGTAFSVWDVQLEEGTATATGNYCISELPKQCLSGSPAYVYTQAGGWRYRCSYGGGDSVCPDAEGYPKSALKGLEYGLQLRLNMDGDWKDSSSYGRNGMASGAVSFTGDAKYGSNAGSFNGGSVTWSYGSSTTANNFTIAAWVKATTTHEIDPESTSGYPGTGGQRYLFGANHGGSTNSGAGISAGTNGISVYEHGDSYMPALAVYSGNIGTGWSHIAVTYTGKQPRIYLNGQLVRVGLTSPRANVYAPTQLGAGSYGYFPGTVDQVAIWDRALTQEEIARLYNNNWGNPGLCKTDTIFSCPSGTTGAWYGPPINKYQCSSPPECLQGGSFNTSTNNCQAVAYDPKCPEGYTLDTSFNPPRCVMSVSQICTNGGTDYTDPAKPGASFCALSVPCPSGYGFNRDAGRCEMNPQCPTGGVFSYEDKKCLKDPFYECPAVDQHTYQYSDLSGKCELPPVCPTGGEFNSVKDQCYMGETQCPYGSQHTCMKVDGVFRCSPNECVDMAGMTEEEEDDDLTSYQDDGAVDENGNCSGFFLIFNGKAGYCRTAKSWDTFKTSCCNEDIAKVQVGGTTIWSETCRQEEIDTVVGREADKCVYMGSYCKKKVKILGMTIGCRDYRKTYCCFDNKLARIIHNSSKDAGESGEDRMQRKSEGGRGQLKAFNRNGDGNVDTIWGTAKYPDCRGFKPDEFAMIDFSKLDLSEYVSDMQNTAQTQINTQQIQQNTTNQIQNYYQNILQSQ